MKHILSTLGLHVDQQSLSNLSAKVLGVGGMIAGGVLSPAAILCSGFGIELSMAANDRIKFWAVAVGAIVTYFTSQNTDQHAGK